MNSPSSVKSAQRAPIGPPPRVRRRTSRRISQHTMPSEEHVSSSSTVGRTESDVRGVRWPLRVPCSWPWSME